MKGKNSIKKEKRSITYPKKESKKKITKKKEKKILLQ
jgi:hypothetical protein